MNNDKSHKKVRHFRRQCIWAVTISILILFVHVLLLLFEPEKASIPGAKGIAITFSLLLLSVTPLCICNGKWKTVPFIVIVGIRSWPPILIGGIAVVLMLRRGCSTYWAGVSAAVIPLFLTFGSRVLDASPPLDGLSVARGILESVIWYSVVQFVISVGAIEEFRGRSSAHENGE